MTTTKKIVETRFRNSKSKLIHGLIILKIKWRHHEFDKKKLHDVFNVFHSLSLQTKISFCKIFDVSIKKKGAKILMKFPTLLLFTFLYYVMQEWVNKNHNSTSWRLCEPFSFSWGQSSECNLLHKWFLFLLYHKWMASFDIQQL